MTATPDCYTNGYANNGSHGSIDEMELPPPPPPPPNNNATMDPSMVIADLNELTVLNIEHVVGSGTPTISTEDPNKALPKTTLMVIAGTEIVNTTSSTIINTSFDFDKDNDNAEKPGPPPPGSPDRPPHPTNPNTTSHSPPQHKRTPSLMSSFNELDFATFDTTNIVVTNWNLQTKYSDFIIDGLRYLREKNNAKRDDDPTKKNDEALCDENIVMLFESPCTSTTNASFTNTKNYRFHDWPPLKSTRTKGILGPCRYASMNGNALPVFLRESAPTGLMDHWTQYLPHFLPPTFVSTIQPDQTVYAYLPVESLDRHVNDPAVHYHLAGKDAIHLMTQKTTRLLHDTKSVRPCVVKTTHSMGSKGIFIIADDEDELQFQHFLQVSGHPTFVITDFVDIHRNVACHFFMHPDGSIVWFGSNENHRDGEDGKFSSDSYLIMKDQAKLKRMQMPFVEEVVTYCQSLQFWGFCGIDVLFDSMGKGYLVDINPRVTGSCPALMTLSLLHQQYGYSVGLFRRTGDTTYHGSAAQLLQQVDTHNQKQKQNHENGNSATTTTTTTIIIHSFLEVQPNVTRINIGVYGHDLDECKRLLNEYAQPAAAVVVVPPAAAPPTPEMATTAPPTPEMATAEATATTATATSSSIP